MKDHAGGAKRALEGFFKRQSNIARKKARTREPSKPRGNPERDLVEVPCVKWMEARGWSGQVYESKAKLQVTRSGKEIWKSSGMKFGTADWQGCTDEGHAAIVEFKAPGRLASFWKPGNERQQDYIINKINAGAFAVVVDSAETLDDLYVKWHGLRRIGFVVAQQFLRDSLPPRPKEKPGGCDSTGLF